MLLFFDNPAIPLFCHTHSISGLKSRVLKLTFLALMMMVKSGLEFILKFTEPLQRYLLTCQANQALLGRFFCTGQQQLWRGSVNFKINSRPLFTIIFKLKNVNFKTWDFSPLIPRVLSVVVINFELTLSFNKKFKNWFFFFTCILPCYVPHESSKEFLKNSHF